MFHTDWFFNCLLITFQYCVCFRPVSYTHLAQKDKLEYEAMVRNPETAYRVSDEAFDKQIDELGRIA